MSEMDRIEISCPECKTTQTTQVWRSLNPCLDPQDKKLLFAGKINLFYCESCSYEALIPIDFIYHDTAQKYCVQVYSPHSIESPEFINSFTSEGLPMWVDTLGNLGTQAPHLLRPHIVFDMGELVRYVKFRDSLAATQSELSEKKAAA
jgi:hypothetical protein